MANKPFFVAEDFFVNVDIPDTNEVTLLTASADVVLKTLSFSNSSAQSIKCQIIINDLHFTDVIIPPHSGYDDGAGDLVRRFEAFEDGTFPGSFNNSGVGYFGFKLGDTIKLKLYAALPGGSSFNAAATGSNT